MSKTYTYKELIDTYIQMPRLVGIHPDFNTYYNGLIATLEQLFDVKINLGRHSKFDDHRLWPLAILFDDTVNRMRFGGVGDGFLEGGPYFSLLELAKENPDNKTVLQTFNDVKEREKDLFVFYRSLLYQLFPLFYGKTDPVFTSTDLLQAGFDDSKEPNIRDYYDYI